MPPTLITRDRAEIEAFRRQHGDVVMKPLYGHGGAAVFKVAQRDPNFGSLFDLFSATFREPWVVQEFLPNVVQRRQAHHPRRRRGGGRGQPRAGGERHPLQHGARRGRGSDPVHPREREICETIGPELKRRGLLLVGIDVIDGYLTEINVTSPTGIRAIKRTGGPDLAVGVWDAIEAKHAGRDDEPPALSTCGRAGTGQR